MKKLACLLLLALLALLPAVLGEYYVNLGSQILIAVIFATSLNLLVGYAGLTSLGHAAYLGLSAYIAGWLALHLGLGHAMAAPLTLLATTAIGVIPAARSRSIASASAAGSIRRCWSSATGRTFSAPMPSSSAARITE